MTECCSGDQVFLVWLENSAIFYVTFISYPPELCSNSMGGDGAWDNRMSDMLKNFDLNSTEVKQQFGMFSTYLYWWAKVSINYSV